MVGGGGARDLWGVWADECGRDGVQAGAGGGVPVAADLRRSHRRQDLDEEWGRDVLPEMGGRRRRSLRVW